MSDSLAHLYRSVCARFYRCFSPPLPQSLGEALSRLTKSVARRCSRLVNPVIRFGRRTARFILRGPNWWCMRLYSFFDPPVHSMGEAARRICGWFWRRKSCLPGMILLGQEARAYAVALQLESYDPLSSKNDFIRRHSGFQLRKLIRRWRYGTTPSSEARAAMILGQSLDMLNLSAAMLEMYRKDVFNSSRSLPTLDLIDRTRRPLVMQGESAIDYLQDAVRRAPNYAEAWLELGRLLLDSGRTDEAIGALKAVSISASFSDPDRNSEGIYELANGPYVKAWFYIGQAYERLGNERSALDAYSEAFVYQPDSATVSRAMADLLFRQGIILPAVRYWGAAMTYRPFVVALPKDGRNLHTLARIIDTNLRRLGIGHNAISSSELKS